MILVGELSLWVALLMAAWGAFRATTLLAKCASRYENAPEKYKDTPGYKRADQRA